jgi:hypothetical protein
LPDHLLIACTLEATEFSAREAQIAQLGRDALISASVGKTRAELRFAAGAGIRERVESFIEAESRCCAFFTMHIDDAPDELRVTIEAPADAELALQELVAAFQPEQQAA